MKEILIQFVKKRHSSVISENVIIKMNNTNIKRIRESFLCYDKNVFVLMSPRY